MKKKIPILTNAGVLSTPDDIRGQRLNRKYFDSHKFDGIGQVFLVVLCTLQDYKLILNVNYYNRRGQLLRLVVIRISVGFCPISTNSSYQQHR